MEICCIHGAITRVCSMMLSGHQILRWTANVYVALTIARITARFRVIEHLLMRFRTMQSAAIAALVTRISFQLQWAGPKSAPLGVF